MRVFIAALLSSLSVVPFYLILLAVSGDLDNRLLYTVLIGALVVATVAIFCIALPLHLLLTRLGLVRGYYYIGAGFFAPAIFTLLLNPLGSDVASWVKWQALGLGLLGGSVAFVFWSLATAKSKT
ncbi:hypothetical protein [Oceanicoccus sagamiensis]|uniref:Major facilitator superfamily (MFS) profile domain-containing protein n=1 Tax=Oceanicoccus sagamiensis TaxID=716816 RepID=A0A1X9NBU5_9GAMM|nr:hypothetical protein [Oceanicoccus sagamiensis]ARN73375.1 hypothetical protein BST96_04175 [Oceanicoccus sagamiensis]